MIIKEIKCERVLSPTSIEIADYVINPYRGCQFGCVYCYARKNKNLKNWGEALGVKKNCLKVLDKELATGVLPKRVLIGSTTEPYQQVEAKYLLTRKILERLQEFDIASVILTKSDLIVRDIDILKKNSLNKVCFTINTLAERDKVVFEKESSLIADRLDAVKKLNDAGIRTYIHIGPIFPFVTDVIGLMHRVKDITSELVFESFNFRMGEEQNVFEKIINSFPEKYKFFKEVFFNEEKYYNYWDNLKKDILLLNEKLNYRVTFFFRPFDEFYNVT